MTPYVEDRIAEFDSTVDGVLHASESDLNRHGWFVAALNLAEDAADFLSVVEAARAYQIARAEGVPERQREAFRQLDSRLADLGQQARVAALQTDSATAEATQDPQPMPAHQPDTSEGEE